MNKKERPILKNLIKEDTSELEYFQNITIRPIIKMQHHLLILSLNNYLRKRKISLENLSEIHKRIIKIVQKRLMDSLNEILI